MISSPPGDPSRAFARREPAAFSLIEVTIALAIVAFAMVAIMALIPVGMRASSDAIRANVEAEIVQEITRELMATPFTSLDSYLDSNEERFYDYDGQRVEDEEAAVFFVTLEESDDVENDATSLLAHLRANGTADQPLVLRTFTIQVRGPGGAEPETYPIHVNSRSALVAHEVP